MREIRASITFLILFQPHAGHCFSYQLIRRLGDVVPLYLSFIPDKDHVESHTEYYNMPFSEAREGFRPAVDDELSRNAKRCAFPASYSIMMRIILASDVVVQDGLERACHL